MHILPASSSKSAPGVPVVSIFEVQIELSLMSRAVQILLTSSSKSAPSASVFNDFCGLSLQSSALFADLIFQERFEVQISSCHSPVHDLSTTFPDPGPQPRKQRPYFGDHGSHFTRKNTSSRAREVFTPEFTRFRTITLPSYLVMMWLT